MGRGGGGGGAATAVDKSILQCSVGSNISALAPSLVGGFFTHPYLATHSSHAHFCDEEFGSCDAHWGYYGNSDVSMSRDSGFMPSDSFRLEKDGRRR